uniref:Uncharacterized protein n=1 Tax=Steinernema glaseri TaxID=37863 RepID=A0A1I8ATE7_9BILA
METGQSRIRHASIESRPYGASVSSVPESRHQRFPSPHLTNDVFLHVDRWQSQENSAKQSYSLCDRLTGLCMRQRAWVRGHPVVSMIIGVALLLLLLLVAIGLVLLFTLQSHSKKTAVVDVGTESTTLGTTSYTPKKDFPNTLDQVVFELPANITQLESLEPCRRHPEHFFAVGNQTLLTFRWINSIRKISRTMTIEALEIERKNCSKCHFYDRQGVNNTALYCCVDCPEFSFFCSLYGMETVYYEKFLAARIFYEDQNVIFHCITEATDGGDSSFLRLHRAIINENNVVNLVEEGPLQRSHSHARHSNMTAFAYVNSSTLDWDVDLADEVLTISSFNSSESLCKVSNFFPNDSLSTTALFGEGAHSPDDHCLVAAVSATSYGIARFKPSSHRCEYGTEAYALPPFEVFLFDAAISRDVLLIGHQNASSIYLQAGGFGWHLPE